MNDFCLTTDERVLQGYKQARADVLKEELEFLELVYFGIEDQDKAWAEVYKRIEKLKAQQQEVKDG